MTVADVVHAHALDAADEGLLLAMLGLADDPAPAPRAARVRPVIPSAVHGRRATYVRGCGCPRCRLANARYVQQWRSRGCCPAVTHGARLRLVELETACGRGRWRVWPGQLALVVPAARQRRGGETQAGER